MGKENESQSRSESLKQCNPLVKERVAEHSIGVGLFMSTKGGGAAGFGLGAASGSLTGLAHGKHSHNLCMEGKGHDKASFSEITKTGGCTIS